MQSSSREVFVAARDDGPVAWRIVSGGERYFCRQRDRPATSFYKHIFNTAGYPGDLSARPHVPMFFDAANGTRLDKDKFDPILTWLNNDSGNPPTDLPILIDDGENSSGFFPATAFQDLPGVPWHSPEKSRHLGATHHAVGRWALATRSSFLSLDPKFL